MKLINVTGFLAEKNVIIRHEHKQYRVAFLPPDTYDVYTSKRFWIRETRNYETRQIHVHGELEQLLIDFAKEVLKNEQAADR